MSVFFTKIGNTSILFLDRNIIQLRAKVAFYRIDIFFSKNLLFHLLNF